MNADEPKCDDCGGALNQIRLIDKGHGGAHFDMEYASHESRRGIWMGKYPIEGKVIAVMCSECGRITLYGRPNTTT